MDTLSRNFDTATVDRMTRVTLNGGYVKGHDPEDEKLIQDFLASKQVAQCPPSNVPGSEASRATKELIARKRREYRKANK